MQLFANAKPHQQGVIFRIWSSYPTHSWEEIKNTYHQQLKILNLEITEMAAFYFKSYKPKIASLLERHQLQYESYEVEVSKAELNDPENLELTVYFILKQYNLIQNFGHYILLSHRLADGTNSEETVMLELSLDLSIHTYIE